MGVTFIFEYLKIRTHRKEAQTFLERNNKIKALESYERLLGCSLDLLLRQFDEQPVGFIDKVLNFFEGESNVTITDDEVLLMARLYKITGADYELPRLVDVFDDFLVRAKYLAAKNGKFPEIAKMDVYGLPTVRVLIQAFPEAQSQRSQS